MKKSLLMMSVLAIVMSACTSNEEESILQNQEISFQVANFQSQTKALGKNQSSYPTTVPFGTYAWYYQDQTDTHTATAQPFMVNQKITFQTPNWKAEGKTYYWPKTGSIDFISYSPFSTTYTKNIVANKITFSGNINQTDDLMYADKAINKSANAPTYEYNGVPTLFHHALAKLNFKVQQKTMSKGSGDDVTRWAITVKNITLSNLASTGSVELNLASDNKTWTLPTVSSYNVWTNSAYDCTVSWADNTPETPIAGAQTTGQLLTNNAVDYKGKTAEGKGAQNYFVIPQILNGSRVTKVKNYQKFSITYDIVTRLANGNVIVEKDVTKDLNFYLPGETPAPIAAPLQAWEMNKNITYTIIIDPAGDITEIYFDPAIQDWTTKDETKLLYD